VLVVATTGWAQPAKVKVGFIYVGPIGDYGWTNAHDVARKKLETILHPLIRRDSQARIAAAQQPYVLVVVPLLLETGAYRELIGRVLVIDCDEERQIARAMKRSALSSDEVRAIMAAQLPRAKRLAAADDVLHNDADLQALRRQAEALHEKYVALARKASQDASP